VESGARNKELIHEDGVRGASSRVGGREADLQYWP